VLEIAKLIPTALVARKLGDLGADVVKVEPPPDGDYLRRIPPVVEGVSVYHHLLDRNKRSILLDQGSLEDRELLLQLIGASDAVIDGGRPGATAARGIDWRELMGSHPALVVCAVSGFGVDGPWASLPAHGLTIEALAGCLPLGWEGDRPSVARGWHASWAIELGAANAALATCAALLAARAGGRGALIDASCWDAGVESLRYHLALYDATGSPMRELADYGPLYRPYRTGDGRAIFVAALEDKFWRRLCDAVGRPDLVSLRGEGDVDFSANPVLEAELARVFAARPAAEWQALFQEAGVPVGVVMDVPGLLASEELEARHLLERPAGGRSPLANVTDAVRWLDPCDERMGSEPRPPPAPGEHQDEVLATWTARET
jgi:alpha-methylacyl-CoA racemase